MDTEAPTQTPVQNSISISDELRAVFETYMSEHKLPAEFMGELESVFPSDNAFLAVKGPLLDALMPGDRASVLHKSMNHMTILVGVSVRRAAMQAQRAMNEALAEQTKKLEAELAALRSGAVAVPN